jgi:hypothetical protein
MVIQKYQQDIQELDNLSKRQREERIWRYTAPASDDQVKTAEDWSVVTDPPTPPDPESEEPDISPLGLQNLIVLARWIDYSVRFRPLAMNL